MGNTYSESRLCNCQITDNSLISGSSDHSHKSKINNASSGHAAIPKEVEFLRARRGSSSSSSSAAAAEAEKTRRRSKSKSISESEMRGNLREGKVVSGPPEDDLLHRIQKLTLGRNGAGADDESEVPNNPLYYGWFFTPEVSEAINKVVMHLYHSCLQEVAQFQKFILTCCKDADVKDPMEFYNYKRPGKRIRPEDDLEYHITAKFLGRVPDPQYQNLVQPFIDKRFYIHLVGLVFTPRTFGVRVKLTPAQQLMFYEKDEFRNGRILSITSSDNLEQVQREISKELDSYKALKRMHKTNPKCKFKKDKSKIAFRRLRSPRLGKALSAGGALDSSVIMTNSRAHITIACAPNVVPKQTGDDLVDIIDLEGRPTSTNSNFQQDFKMKQGILRQFGRPAAEAFVFYPELEMIVPGKFNYAA